MGESSISLVSILTLEALVLLGGLALFFAALTWRFRKQLYLACEKYRQLKIEYLALKQKVQQQSAQVADSKTLVLRYLEQEITSADSRFNQNAQTSPPQFVDNQPLGANVAALRHLYLNCEKAFLEDQENTFMGWAFFEKRLADLVRKFAKASKGPLQMRSNRMRLLQERIDVLTPYEAENKQLIRKLEKAEKRQKQLEDTEREGRRLITQLKKMLADLQAAEGSQQPPAANPAQKTARNTGEFTGGTIHQLAEYAQQLNQAAGALLAEDLLEIPHLTEEQRQKLEATIHSLEMELFKSNNCISQLQLQLKEGKTELANQAAELHFARSDLREQDKKLAMQDGVLEVTLAETEPAHTARQGRSPDDYFEPHKILTEIRQLRENNKAQRYIIIALQTQVESLKESISATDNEDVKAAQNSKVEQLERMIKEFQLCVETLESEVDNLYHQLQEKINTTPESADKNLDGRVPAEQSNYQQQALEQEIEQLKTKVEQAIHQFHLSQQLNQFVQQLIATRKVDEVAKLCIQLLRDWHTLAGFYVHSQMGNAEYFGAKVFSDEEKKLVKASAKREPVTKTKSGLLFCADKMQLLLSEPPEDEQLKAQLVKGFGLVVGLVSSQLKHLELANHQASRASSFDSWMKTTKSHLSDLDIQYAYLMEESRNTFASLSSELKQALDAMGIKAGTRAVLETALSEYQARMQLLLSTGALVDREISHLLEHMNSVQLN